MLEKLTFFIVSIQRPHAKQELQLLGFPALIGYQNYFFQL